ncbi:MAG: hypothetical protein IPL59_11425 [Candidatus Competibacteraceae bacterium]|nr:hypothetical protein [Candidatus Competibacteraceae bacterium]
MSWKPYFISQESPAFILVFLHGVLGGVLAFGISSIFLGSNLALAIACILVPGMEFPKARIKIELPTDPYFGSFWRSQAQQLNFQVFKGFLDPWVFHPDG